MVNIFAKAMFVKFPKMLQILHICLYKKVIGTRNWLKTQKKLPIRNIRYLGPFYRKLKIKQMCIENCFDEKQFVQLKNHARKIFRYLTFFYHKKAWNKCKKGCAKCAKGFSFEIFQIFGSFSVVFDCCDLIFTKRKAISNETNKLS